MGVGDVIYRNSVGVCTVHTVLHVIKSKFDDVNKYSSNSLKSTNSRNWDISNSLDDSALYTGKGSWHRGHRQGIAVRGDEVHPPPEA